jgi:hypothetical protein
MLQMKHKNRPRALWKALMSFNLCKNKVLLLQ